MYSSELCNFSLWWLIPIAMMILCFFMMRGRRGSMMCGLGSRAPDRQHTGNSESAIDILDKRYATGEINKDEYHEIKRTLNDSTDSVYK